MNIEELIEELMRKMGYSDYIFKCSKCGKDGQEAHLCPFKQEIFDLPGAAETCHCCQSCQNECSNSL